jgi:hypothetical protein
MGRHGKVWRTKKKSRMKKINMAIMRKANRSERVRPMRPNH